VQNWYGYSHWIYANGLELRPKSCTNQDENNPVCALGNWHCMASMLQKL